MNIQFYPHHIPNISQYILIVSTFSGHAPVGDSHFTHGYTEQRRHRRDLQKSTGTKTSSAGWSNLGPERERENSETGPELVDFFRHKHYYKVNRDFDGIFMEL
jgi:hypothetical protein